MSLKDPDRSVLRTEPDPDATRTVVNFDAAEIVDAVEERFPYLKGEFRATKAFKAMLDAEAKGLPLYSVEHFVNHIAAVCTHQLKQREAIDPNRGIRAKPPAWDTKGLAEWNQEARDLAAFQQAKGNEGAREATKAFFEMTPEDRKIAAQAARDRLEAEGRG